VGTHVAIFSGWLYMLPAGILNTHCFYLPVVSIAAFFLFLHYTSTHPGLFWGLGFLSLLPNIPGFPLKCEQKPSWLHKCSILCAYKTSVMYIMPGSATVPAESAYPWSVVTTLLHWTNTGKWILTWTCAAPGIFPGMIIPRKVLETNLHFYTCSMW
jgi:hypothetical protein